MEVYGLIQHSFALQLAERHGPFRGHTNTERVTERFALSPAPGDEYSVVPVSAVEEMPRESAIHSPLAEHGLTTVASRRMLHLEHRGGQAGSLHRVFDWATVTSPNKLAEHEDPQFAFADFYDDELSPTCNDFRVSTPADATGTVISQTLLELLAQMRSRLFGFALANRFVNVMLPHAAMRPAGSEQEERTWLMQPLVSFIRGGSDRSRLRNTYSLSFFLIPVEVADRESFSSRRMRLAEIKRMVDPGWGYAAAPPQSSLPSFALAGPLPDYLSRLARLDLSEMRPRPGSECGREGRRELNDPLTLRQAVEKIAFAVSISLAQGSSGRLHDRAVRILGNEVVMALGSARVSSVVAVDPDLGASEVRRAPSGARPFPGKLLPLMEELSAPTRPPRSMDPEALAHRLDRPFDDDDLYVTGVIPAKRCLIVVSRGGAQCGSRESALMQAGSIAYMTLGAASAIGTMRAIDRRVEALEDADPTMVAQLDREIAADLNEIYDLDITRESYRQVYRRLRDRLGIVADYETLRDEMQTLYQAAATFHEHRSGRLLAWLTAAIVGLSVLILIGTVALALKGG